MNYKSTVGTGLDGIPIFRKSTYNDLNYSSGPNASKMGWVRLSGRHEKKNVLFLMSECVVQMVHNRLKKSISKHSLFRRNLRLKNQ